MVVPTFYVRAQLQGALNFLELRGRSPATDWIRRAIDGCDHVDAKFATYEFALRDEVLEANAEKAIKDALDFGKTVDLHFGENHA